MSLRNARCKKGQEVKLFRLPEDPTKCLIFVHKRDLKNEVSMFICSGCHSIGQVNKVQVSKFTRTENSLKVSKDSFISNPMAEPHLCLPFTYSEEVAKRMRYSTYQFLRSDPNKFTASANYSALIDEVLQDGRYRLLLERY